MTTPTSISDFILRELEEAKAELPRIIKGIEDMLMYGEPQTHTGSSMIIHPKDTPLPEAFVAAQGEGLDYYDNARRTHHGRYGGIYRYFSNGDHVERHELWNGESGPGARITYFSRVCPGCVICKGEP